MDVAVDLEGNLYLSEYDNLRIRKVDRDGIITTVAGSGDSGEAEESVPATSAPLWDPWGIAVDSGGNLFIAEHHANVIHKVDANGSITTVAGIFNPSTMGGGLFNGEEGPATEIHLNEPVGLFVDGQGVLYIADTFNACIREVRSADAA